MNNFGDTLCQMRGLKELKDREGLRFDFVTCHYLHWVAANHTDIFENVIFVSPEEINNWAAGGHDYNQVIEFTIDWQNAVDNTILRAWSEKTLGFAPTNPRPYFLLTEEEEITAHSQHAWTMEAPYFRKSIVLQLESISCNERGFLRGEWEGVINMIPEDVAIFYPSPITWAQDPPIRRRPNVIILPGYPMGTTGALMKQVDLVLTVHSGSVMLAYAVGAKPIVHINFLEASGANILRIPEEDGINLIYPSNKQLDWDQLQETINNYLL